MTSKDQIIQVLSTKSFLVSAASVTSFAAGMATTYFVLKPRIVKHYEGVASAEIRAARRHYSVIKKDVELDADFPSGESNRADRVVGAEEALAIIQEQGYAAPEADIAEVVKEAVQESVEDILVTERAEPEVVRNIFKDARSANSIFDYAEEIKTRDPAYPYIISEDEFNENDLDYVQSSLTYFEADDTLVDEKDETIEDIGGIVGDQTVHNFGYGSKDKNIVYARNEKLEIDFEITRSQGSFVEEVLGFIEHSDDSGKNRKFRHDLDDRY